MPPLLAAFLLAAGLAAVHLLAGRLRFLRVVPRSRVLSLSAGVSVAYVFVHLLPETAARQAALARETGTANAASTIVAEQFLFVVALVGFATFYGLERLARRSRDETGEQAVVGGAATRTSVGVFWIHVGSFAAYNGLVGYLLLHREAPGVVGLLLYATAMAVHFVVNDYGLRDHHREAYDRVGRWALAGSVLVGFGVGLLLVVPAPLLHLMFALLAGGVVLNVIKEELPAERESRFWAFGVGAGAYAAVLLGV